MHLLRDLLWPLVSQIQPNLVVSRRRDNAEAIEGITCLSKLFQACSMHYQTDGFLKSISSLKLHLVISWLVPRLNVLEAADRDILYCLLSSTATAEREDTDGTWPGRERHLGYLFQFSAKQPARSLPPWALHEASWHWSLRQPQLSCGWESCLLKTATASTKECWFCNFANMLYWLLIYMNELWYARVNCWLFTTK